MCPDTLNRVSSVAVHLLHRAPIPAHPPRLFTGRLGKSMDHKLQLKGHGGQRQLLGQQQDVCGA